MQPIYKIKINRKKTLKLSEISW